MSYIFREETFGGIVIDTAREKTLEVNASAFEIIKALLQDKESDIIHILKEKFDGVEKDVVEKDISAVKSFLNSWLSETEDVGAIEQEEVFDNFNTGQEVLSAPLDVFWEITWKCNLSCKHCYSMGGERNLEELDTEECIDLLHQCSEAGVYKLIIGGGEPLTRYDLLQIFEEASKLHFKVILITNGTLINKKIAKRLSEFKIKVGVSLDGYNDLTNDVNRGKGSFQKTLKGIKYMVVEGIPVGIQTSVTPHNIDSLEEIIKLAINLNCHSWSAKLLLPVGRARRNYLDFIRGLDLFKLDTLFHNLTEKYKNQIEIAAEIPIINSFKKFKGGNLSVSPVPDGPVICGPGFRTCGLTPDGRLLTCSYIQSNGWLSESVREKKFLDMWKSSPIFAPFRKLVFSDLYQCQRCPLLEECHGGCRAIAVNVNSDFFSKDPLCILERIKIPSEKEILVS